VLHSYLQAWRDAGARLNFHAVPVTTLDDVPPEEFPWSPVHFAGGRHNRFDQAPEDVRVS
jgi:hypothetical protein